MTGSTRVVIIATQGIDSLNKVVTADTPGIVASSFYIFYSRFSHTPVVAIATVAFIPSVIESIPIVAGTFII